MSDNLHSLGITTVDCIYNKHYVAKRKTVTKCICINKQEV